MAPNKASPAVSPDSNVPQGWYQTGFCSDSNGQLTTLLSSPDLGETRYISNYDGNAPIYPWNHNNLTFHTTPDQDRREEVREFLEYQKQHIKLNFARIPIDKSQDLHKWNVFCNEYVNNARELWEVGYEQLAFDLKDGFGIENIQETPNPKDAVIDRAVPVAFKLALKVLHLEGNTTEIHQNEVEDNLFYGHRKKNTATKPILASTTNSRIQKTTEKKEQAELPAKRKYQTDSYNNHEEEYVSEDLYGDGFYDLLQIAEPPTFGSLQKHPRVEKFKARELTGFAQSESRIQEPAKGARSKLGNRETSPQRADRVRRSRAPSPEDFASRLTPEVIVVLDSKASSPRAMKLVDDNIANLLTVQRRAERLIQNPGCADILQHVLDELQREIDRAQSWKILLDQYDTYLEKIRKISGHENSPSKLRMTNHNEITKRELKSWDIISTILSEFAPAIPIYEALLDKLENLPSGNRTRYIQKAVQGWVVNLLRALSDIE